jgi:RNA-binding protein 23/39
MSSFDVEALLESTANATPVDQNEPPSSKESDDRYRSERNERRDRDRNRDGSRDRERDRKRRDRSRDKYRREVNGDKELIGTPTSDHGSAHGSVKSRRRSRSREDDRRNRRHRDSPDDGGRRDGDYYRGGGRTRSRSRSPNRNAWRPRGDRRDRDEVDARPREDRRDHHEGRRASRSPKRESTPPLTEDERDRRTVFVQQLAARLRTKELVAFFEKVGPVKEAQIVKDRVSGRSKGYTTSFFMQIFILTCLIVLATLSLRKKNRSPLLFNSLDRNS